MIRLTKLHTGDRVAILSPSFGAPAVWPDVYQLGLQRLRNVFNLEPVEFPTTKKMNASATDRALDLVAAFEDESIKAVIATVGGDDQVTYVSRLPIEPFVSNPKPFFGFSDNSHFANFLWLAGVPSYYGGGLFTQFAMQGEMDEFTIKYLKYAFFESGEQELTASPVFNEIGWDWGDSKTLNQRRVYESNDGWVWSGTVPAQGISWGGCVESIDDMLRHGVRLPTLEQFKNVILIAETSEEIPSHEYVYRVFRALGERGILKHIRGLLVGRPKAWEFDKPQSGVQRIAYHLGQIDIIHKAVRQYNADIPIVQNVDFGHTDPQIPLPYGFEIKIDPDKGKITSYF